MNLIQKLKTPALLGLIALLATPNIFAQTQSTQISPPLAQAQTVDTTLQGVNLNEDGRLSISGRFAFGIDRNTEGDETTNQLGVYEGRIQFDKPSLFKTQNVCVNGHADIDVRPLIGMSRVRTLLHEEVVEGVETVLKIKIAEAMSMRFQKQVRPDEVTVPQDMLTNALNNFTDPKHGFNGKGVDSYVAYVTRDDAVTDATIRQAYVSIGFGACENTIQSRDQQPRYVLTVGKVNPVTFNPDTSFHPYISGPAIRAKINFSKVSFYVEMKNDRGSVISEMGDAAGEVKNLTLRGSNILTYNPNSLELGTDIDLSISRLILAINKQEGDELSLVTHIDNRGYASEKRILGYSAQVIIQRLRGSTGLHTITMSDVAVWKELFSKLTLSAQRFQRSGRLETSSLTTLPMDQFLSSSQLGAEYKLAESLWNLRVSTDIVGQVYWNKSADAYMPAEFQRNRGVVSYIRMKF